MQAVQRGGRQRPMNVMPPSDLLSSAQHRQAIDIRLLSYYTAQMEDVTRGPTSRSQPVVGTTTTCRCLVAWEGKRSGAA